jgi:serine protease Do
MSTRKATLFYAVLIAVASTAIGMVIASRLDLSPESSAQTTQTLGVPSMNSAPLTGTIDMQTFRTIAKTQTPMVVNIQTEQRRRTQELTDFFGGDDDMFRRFFGDQAPRRRQPERTFGAGTGFVIDKSGLILTNNHVVEGATRIRVGFFGDEEAVFDAKVLGRDPLTDSALIELTEKPNRELPVAKFGDSEQMQPGDWVMAIGNPFNFSHTVTVGVVSAIGRPFPTSAPGREQHMIQTDAAINPGNSGGPLLNLRGEVVGINTAIISDRAQSGNLGIGFAVPINAVRELLPELRKGKVTRGVIGVGLSRQVPKEVFEELGAKDGHGALVSTVEPNGPAGKAGLKAGDVIVEYNGRPVKDNDELVNQVVRTVPGTSVPVKVLRDRQPKSLSITVDELELDEEGDQAGGREGDVTAGFGMTLQDLTPDIARQLRVPSGTTGAVIVDLEPNGGAARAGLQVRDVIIEVNRAPVSTAAEASRALQRTASGQVAMLLVLRNGQETFVTVRKE